jgi:hypothetical protein
MRTSPDAPTCFKEQCHEIFDHRFYFGKQCMRVPCFTGLSHFELGFVFAKIFDHKNRLRAYAA